MCQGSFPHILTIAEHIEIEAKGLQGPITLYDVRGLGGPHNLWLPEEHDILCILPQALPLHYTVLEEKYLSGVVCAGVFVKLSARRGEIYSDAPVVLWGNIKMWLFDGNGDTVPGDLYGKVVGALPGQTPGFAVHVIFRSPDLRAFLQPWPRERWSIRPCVRLALQAYACVL